MVKLDFLHELTPQTKSFSVVEANQVRQSQDEETAESSLRYELTLNNGSKILLNVYVVYSVPDEATKDGDEDCYTWKLVKRGYCKRGCKGPILRAIQRFGKLGRRCSEIWSSTNYRSVKQLHDQAANSKDHRFLFISIDEACTHVAMGDKKTRFRLLFGVDDARTGKKIGSAVSAPIRVLANNDAPNGAAYINMPIPLTENWEGWRSPLAERLRRSLDAAAVLEGPQTPDSNAAAAAEREAVLDSILSGRNVNKRARGSVGGNKKAAVTLLHPKKRAKQLAAVVTPIHTKVKLEKGEVLEGPQTPSPTSIETVRASMTNAMAGLPVIQQAAATTPLAGTQGHPAAAMQLFSPAGQVPTGLLNVPMFSPVSNHHVQIMATYLQAYMAMQQASGLGGVGVQQPQQQQAAGSGPAGTGTAEKK